MAKNYKKNRLQFDFTPEQVSALDNMVKKTNAATRAEVVRKALSCFDWFINQGIEDKPINLSSEQIRVMCTIFTKPAGGGVRLIPLFYPLKDFHISVKIGLS